jgi:rhamnosyltransferase
MSSLKSDDVAALVVGYFPDQRVVLELLKVLSTQVGHLILIDNGGSSNVAEICKNEKIVISYIQFEKNLGLGYALNAGFEKAIRFGVRYVATFDQDSAPPEDLIYDLKSQHLRLQHEGVKCAAVGPVFFDRRETPKTYFPFYFEADGRIHSATRESWKKDELVQTDALITSGMLVRADVWASGVRYDEGLFVDYTDTEWCFRARAAGYKLFGCMQIEMGHAPSDAPPARMMGFSFFRYSPLRRFYYFRNTVKFCVAPYVSWAWKRRLLMGLTLRFGMNLVIDRKKWASLTMMARGVSDALRGRTGEFTK